MTPDSITRYQSKGHVVLSAWRSLLGDTPSIRALARVMAIAEFESRLGDARGWANEHNWGAIKKRGLSALEDATLRGHGITPDGSDAAVVAARALLHGAPDEALHTDRSPGKGPHFAWFWSFASDADAARKFLQVLLLQRPHVRAALDNQDVTDVARAMFVSHYYEGDSTDDPEANIRAYAAHVRSYETLIANAFSAPTPRVMSPHDVTAAGALPSLPDTQARPVAGPSGYLPAVFSPSSAPAFASTATDTTGVHVFVGAMFLIFGQLLAKGAHR